MPTDTCQPWHFLYFFPDPHGHGSLRPGRGVSYLTVGFFNSSPVTNRHCPSSRSNRLFSRWFWSCPFCVYCASKEMKALFSLTTLVSNICSPRQVDVCDHSRMNEMSISFRVRE